VGPSGLDKCRDAGDGTPAPADATVLTGLDVWLTIADLTNVVATTPTNHKHIRQSCAPDKYQPMGKCQM